MFREMQQTALNCKIFKTEADLFLQKGPQMIR